jgi:hypothetical protein
MLLMILQSHIGHQAASSLSMLAIVGPSTALAGLLRLLLVPGASCQVPGASCSPANINCWRYMHANLASFQRTQLNNSCAPFLCLSLIWRHDACKSRVPCCFPCSHTMHGTFQSAQTNTNCLPF